MINFLQILVVNLPLVLSTSGVSFAYALAKKGDITGNGMLLSSNKVIYKGGEFINSGTAFGRQAIEHQNHIPKGMSQEVYIDLRGQSYSNKDLIDIRNKIILNSNGILDKRNIHFMENEK